MDSKQNLLKNITTEKNTYEKMYHVLNFEEIFQSLFSGITQYRFFNISFPDENHISLSTTEDFFHLEKLYQISRWLDDDWKAGLLLMKEKKTFHIKHKNKILFYLHLDWLFAIEQIRKGSDYQNDLVEYLQFETDDSNILNKIKHFNGHSKNRSNLFTFNQDSIIIDLQNKDNSKNLDKISKINYSLILKNKLLHLIEIDQDIEDIKLTSFLKSMNFYCNKITKLHPFVLPEQKFTIKLRKIKRTHKKGLFIAHQNTIVLDPRYSDSFLHELGHWYHHIFFPHIVKDKDAEEFVEDFILSMKKK